MRLIDADALNYVRVRIAHDDGTIGGYNAVVPSSEIKNAPTVDAVPVRHGRWISRPAPSNSYCGYLICSNCGEEVSDADEYNYCPNCGSDMRGDNSEHE